MEIIVYHNYTIVDVYVETLLIVFVESIREL